MERATPVRKTHTSTAGLLSWPETPAKNKSSSTASLPLSNQPSDGMTKVLSGDQITGGEAESLNRSVTFKKECSEYKLKEMSGSNIFEAEGEDTVLESGGSIIASKNRTSVRIVQQAANGISQISFSTEELSPKKPHSLTEAAKQRELCGTLENELDSKIGKQFSNSKSKELSGHDIFGTPSEVFPRASAAVRSLEPKESHGTGEPVPRHIRTSVKVSNPAGGQSNIIFGEDPTINSSAKKIHNQKFAELTGNDIFKGIVPPGSAEKSLSNAKLREMNGSDIFSDGKAEPREFLGGRKPPGGDSSIALI